MSSRRTCRPVAAATARFPIRQSFVLLLRSHQLIPSILCWRFLRSRYHLYLFITAQQFFIIILSVYSHWYIHDHARVHRFSCIRSFSSAQPPSFLLRQTAAYRIHSIIMGICSSCLGNRRRDYNDVCLICFQPLLRARRSICAICDHGQPRTIKKLYN